MTDNILQAKIKDRDSKHLDPTERANWVNTFMFSALGIDDPERAVTHPLYWDLLCYCVEMVNLFALGTGHEQTLQITQVLNNHFKSLHYSLPDGEPQLGPPREEHEEIWKNRVEQERSTWDTT